MNLSSLFMQIVQVRLQANQCPTKMDIVGQMVTDIANHLTKVEQAKRQLSNSVKPLEKMLGRFTVKDGENIFEAAIRTKITELENKIAAAEKEVEMVKACKKFLAKCKYKFDPAPSQSATSTTRMQFVFTGS